MKPGNSFLATIRKQQTCCFIIYRYDIISFHAINANLYKNKNDQNLYKTSTYYSRLNDEIELCLHDADASKQISSQQFARYKNKLFETSLQVTRSIQFQRFCLGT